MAEHVIFISLYFLILIVSRLYSADATPCHLAINVGIDSESESNRSGQSGLWMPRVLSPARLGSVGYILEFVPTIWTLLLHSYNQ